MFAKVLELDTSGRAEVRALASASLAAAVATRAQKQTDMALKVKLYQEACGMYEACATLSPMDAEVQLHWGETILEMLMLSAENKGPAAELQGLFDAAQVRFTHCLQSTSMGTSLD